MKNAFGPLVVQLVLLILGFVVDSSKEQYTVCIHYTYERQCPYTDVFDTSATGTFSSGEQRSKRPFGSGRGPGFVKGLTPPVCTLVAEPQLKVGAFGVGNFRKGWRFKSSV